MIRLNLEKAKKRRIINSQKDRDKEMGRLGWDRISENEVEDKRYYSVTVLGIFPTVKNSWKTSCSYTFIIRTP